MSFAQLLDHAGGMGRFQALNVLLLSLPLVFLAAHNLLQNFTAAVPGHWCRAAPNATCGPNATEACGHNPAGGFGVAERARHSCRRSVSPRPNATGLRDAEGATEPCVDGWAYEDHTFASTIVTEWDLVCEFRTSQQTAQSIYMTGVLVGAVVLGGLSDKFGRKPLLIWSCFQTAVSGSCAAFAPSFTAYCVFRFLCGMAVSGIGMNCISLAMEWTPTRSRATVSMVTGQSYSVGQFLLAGIAYGIRDWRWLQLAVSLPFLAFFLYAWWFAESARWYATAGKLDRALQELWKVARINGQAGQAEKLSLETVKASLQKETPSANSTFAVADLMGSPVLRKITTCLCFVWFSTSFAYYGLAMDLQNFGVSIYLIQVIFGAVDIPAKLIAFLTIYYLGRRFTQALSLILAGVSIVGNIFVPQDMPILRTTFAVFGKGCLAASFNCVFLYTGELYPTVVRQTGMGFGNTMARIGGIVAPLVKMTDEYSPSLPLLVYGVAPIISGVAACFLPETLNVPLPDTIQDVEKQNLRPSERSINGRDQGFHPDQALLHLKELEGAAENLQPKEDAEGRDTGTDLANHG